MNTYVEFPTATLDAAFVPPADRPDLTAYVCTDGQSAKWSGKNPVPSVGERIEFQFWNEWHAGTVLGYFREGGWFGVLVKPETCPKDYLKRNKGRALDKVHAFGLEVRAAAQKI